MQLLKKLVSAAMTTIQTHRAPNWIAEPVRTIANRVAAGAVAAGTALVVANTLTTFVPVTARDRVSAAVAFAAAAAAAVAKYAGRVGRAAVFAPATFHASLAQATAASLRAPAPAVPGADGDLSHLVPTALQR